MVNKIRTLPKKLKPKAKEELKRQINKGKAINWVYSNISFYVQSIVEGRYSDSNWIKILREKGTINNIRII